MEEAPSSQFTFTFLLLLLLFAISSTSLKISTKLATPLPTPWPPQFHSILFINASSGISLVDLWYDWPNARNFNIIHHQLGTTLFDLEWGNGTSFYYTLREPFSCRTVHFDVGILRPDWLDGASYVGQERIDGFLCNVWAKAEFIMYYEDVESKRPVHWLFHTGRSVHVMTFEEGAVLDDAEWQAPVYCFDKQEEKSRNSSSVFTEAFEASMLHKKILGKILVT